MLEKQGRKKHGWAPKLSFWFFNMTFNNTYTRYILLYCINVNINKIKTNEIDCLKSLSMDDAIESDHVRKRAAYHPPSQRDYSDLI